MIGLRGCEDLRRHRDVLLGVSRRLRGTTRILVERFECLKDRMRCS